MFLGLEAWPVSPTPIETCRSSGAWLSPAGLLAINMALLTELSRRFHTEDPCKAQRPYAPQYSTTGRIGSFQHRPNFASQYVRARAQFEPPIRAG